MQTITVLVIADGPEATVICAALAKHAHVRAINVLDADQAIKLLETQGAPPALAIGDSAALTKSTDELVRILQARGIPLIGIAAGLSQNAKQRALAAGVKEIHDRPGDWHAYTELIEAVMLRFGHKN
jgi:response regulator RpfG family c-di-GMP phosphodiesterase